MEEFFKKIVMILYENSKYFRKFINKAFNMLQGVIDMVKEGCKECKDCTCSTVDDTNLDDVLKTAQEDYEVNKTKK